MERLLKVGEVPVKSSLEVHHSRIGIGFEKLDRDVFDPEKAYDKVAAIGVKWIRLQSGWQKTEKEKGVYEFSWLDRVVDNLISRGMKPWICLCYGNALYGGQAEEVFGAVGCPPIFTEEQRTGWAGYVRALVRHFKDRVQAYEIWNEPDGIWCWKHGVNARELGEFTRDTARIIREEYAEAEIIGGVICSRDLHFINEALKTGMGETIDAISFHEYTDREELVFERVDGLRAIGRKFNPNMKIIQGESGSQSRSGGNGALKTGAWTQRKQAKQLLRHTMADLMTNVQFTSYFSCMDMIEALNGKVGDKLSWLDYGYFGVLSADFDENGVATGEYTPKQSYTALSVLASLFAEDFESCTLPVLYKPEESPRIFGYDLPYREVIAGGFIRENGAKAYAYWHPSSIMTTDFEGTVTLEIADVANPPKLIDPMDGSIYDIPGEILEYESEDCIVLKHLPIRDYPLILVFGNF